MNNKYLANDLLIEIDKQVNGNLVYGDFEIITSKYSKDNILILLKQHSTNSIVIGIDECSVFNEIDKGLFENFIHSKYVKPHIKYCIIIHFILLFKGKYALSKYLNDNILYVEITSTNQNIGLIRNYLLNRKNKIHKILNS